MIDKEVVLEGKGMPFLKTICPSKDRACQLDLLLRSIEQNWNINQLDIYVLYKATSDFFQKGYDLLREKYSDHPNIMFIPEESFAGQVTQIVLASLCNVCFFTDDCIFYRKTDITPSMVCRLLKDNKDILGFSFRLGNNTIIQNYLDGTEQHSLQYFGYKLLNNQIIKWRWKLHPPWNNYGYSYSWDGHIYSASLVYDMIKDVVFTNPRTMEGNISGNMKKRENLPDYFSCPSDSCVVVNTINCVQDFGPPAGQFFFCSVEDLNKHFLDGDIIDMENMDFDNIMSSHLEIPITFKKAA